MAEGLPTSEPSPTPGPAPPPGGVPRVLLVVAAVMGILLVAGSMLAAWLGLDAFEKTRAASSRAFLTRNQQSDTNTAIDSAPLVAEPPASATEPTPAPITPMTDAQWDEYITEQYPAYRVAERISIKNQHRVGMPGMNYLLVNERQPDFELLIGLAQVREQTEIDELPAEYLDATDGIATTDALFSVNARSKASGVTAQGQAAIVDAYVDERPKKRSIVTGGFVDEGRVAFTVVTGPKAIERATKNSEDIDYYADAPLPTRANRFRTTLTLERY